MNKKKILIDKLSFWYDDLLSDKSFTETWGSKTLQYSDVTTSQYLHYTTADIAAEIDKAIIAELRKTYSF